MALKSFADLLSATGDMNAFFDAHDLAVKGASEFQAELQAARNLPDETPASGSSESAGDTSGVARGGLMPLKLNLGSGQRPFKSPWVNVDCQEKWQLDGIMPGGFFVKADIRSMPMFSDNSAEIIVLWHVIEHFGCGEADSIIKECYRILQPGGRLIVATPDLEMLAVAWLDSKITEQIYVTNLYGAYMGDEADRHKWGFSQGRLLDYIGQFGAWSSIGKWEGPAPEGTDISRDFWMATVEAIR